MQHAGLSTKYLREQHKLLTSFDYTLVRNTYHLVYRRAGWPALIRYKTPRSEYESRTRLLAELRRRHPDHEMWRTWRRSGAGAGRRRPLRDERARERARLTADLRAAERAAPSQRRVVPDGPLRTWRLRCGACAHPWFAEGVSLPAECPRCGSDDVGEQQVAA
jgi:hypothetical protein